MGILDFFLGRKADPTFAWPAIAFPLPELDLSTGTLGTLKLVSTLEEAACFGKPDFFKWSDADSCELLYAQQGFQLEFEKSRLTYIAFFINKDEFLPRHPKLRFSEPLIKSFGQLGPKTDSETLKTLFGKPDSEDIDTDETILLFKRQGIILEFELNENQLLKRLNLVLPDDGL